MEKRHINLLTRYLILLALIFSLPIIYKILTPLTTNTTAYVLKLFYQVSMHKDIIIINTNTPIKIISSCVAGSAYLLLLILNLTIPLPLKKRIYTILFSLITLFIINILRITFLSILLVNNFKFFDITHKFFWYFLSTAFVLIIWFLEVKLFKIKSIPVYDDVRFLLKEIKRK